MLKALTVNMAARCLKNGRDYLRTSNGGRPHRQVHFETPLEEAMAWRRQLIAALKQEAVQAQVWSEFKKGTPRRTLCDLLKEPSPSSVRALI